MKKLALACAAVLAMTTAAKAEEFRFVAIGDMPYGKPEAAFPLYEALIGRINETAPDLVLHVGDTKSGSTACDNAMLDAQLGYLNDFEAPVLYTPGDNEWTDCHRKKAGKFDPLERLNYIRTNYFEGRGTTLGKAVKVTHQGDAGFPENARLMHKGVMFVTAHVVGSNNNLEARDLAAVTEFFDRNPANIAWLVDSFAAAKDADALVLAIHADMFEFDFDEKGKEGWLRHSGFKAFGAELKKQAEAFGKPILLVFGDSHIHRTFVPLPKTAPNITALEVFGSKDMHAAEVIYQNDGMGARFAVGKITNPALN